VSLTNILRNINGELELGRTMLATSGFFAITTPILFEVLDMAHNGWHFNVTEWCVAYPGGLAALGALGVFAIGKKDKDVAVARQTQAMAPLSDKTTKTT
jgi:hypothetical protein